jgi:two-component system sensor histidine kinase BaeS
MRRRITRTMVGVVAGALVLASVGTLVLLRLGVRNDTRRELGRQAADIAARLDDVQRPGVLAALGPVLRLEDQRILCFGTGCRGVQTPPPGIGRDDLPLDRLQEGETVTGVRGSRVFAAAGAPVRSDTTFVVVLTRRVDTRLPGGLWFLVAAGLALVVAGAVAGDLARRLTRPLREAQAATGRVAAGDLTARVPVNPEDGEELAALAESINAMAAGLERSRGLERQFLLSVSHDLRTPLTSIRGYAEALAERRAPDTEQAASIILSEARRLERLVGDLLELAKLDARRFSLDVRAVDAAEVVSDTAEGFRPAAEKAGISLDVYVPPAPDRRLAAADPDRLAQVVANLVENALKYARSAIALGTGSSEGGGGVSVWVQDDGPGIGAEDLPHVFEPFYRSTRTPSREVGSGLGLAIVRELTAAMGGEVRAVAVESGFGGTRVVVTLRPWSGAGSARAVGKGHGET